MKVGGLASALAVVVGFAVVYASGGAYNVAWLLPMVAVIGAAIRQVISRRRAPDFAVGGQIGSVVFWALLAVVTVLAIPRVQFSPTGFRFAVAVHVCSAAALMAFSALRRAAPSTPRQVVTAAGSAFLVLQLVRVVLGLGEPKPVLLAAPFDGEWAVLQGGPSVLLNHHFSARSQRHAVDLVRVDQGARMKGPASDLASYHCFGSDIRSPAGGVVVAAVSSLPDEPIGQTNRAAPTGNHVVIRMSLSRYVLLAHLQHRSVRVSPGDRVGPGETIARCGNSGNTSEPHLHIQLSTRETLDADGASTFPITFDPGTRLRRNSIVTAART